MTAPLVTVLDPLTWTHGWSYEIEERILSDHGVDFRVPADEDERDALLPQARVIISSSLVKVDAPLLARFKKCVGIVCYSAGMDAVDHDAARGLGITVTNVAYNYTEVADHAMTLLLTLLRKIPEVTEAAAKDEWDLRNLPQIWEIPRLSDLTLGVVGAGRAGREVGGRARAFGMRTVATYRTPPEINEPHFAHRSLNDLAAVSDAVVLCASLTPESRHMIDDTFFEHLKPGAVLVNVARGGLIDEASLLRALDNGVVSAAALDVRDPEPPEPGDPLTAHPRVIQTPHMAGASHGASVALHERTAHRIIDLLAETRPGDDDND